MASPVLLSLVAFACGVLALQTCATLPSHPLALGAAGVLALALSRPRRRRADDRATRWSRLAVIGGAALLGYGYAAVRADVRLADALPEAWEGVDIRVVGVVDDLPQGGDHGIRFALAVEDVATAGAIVPARISVAWPTPIRADAEPVPPPEVHAGERWQLVVRLKRPHGNVNFAGFDLEAWLLERNLRATGYVRPHDANRRLAPFAGRPGDYVERAREAVRTRIAGALPGAPYAGVLTALAIGDQRAIPEAQWLTFNRTGVSHLISISGLHVTAFAALAGALAFAVARRFTRLTSRVPARKLAVAAGAICAFGYVLLAGAEVPAVRTLVMLLAGACGLWLGRPGTASAVWLWSLAAVLVWDPWASLSPGLWLSFGAVGLLLYAGAGRLPRTAPATLRTRARHALREGARAQWVVTIGLVPATLALFQQTSVVSALANAVAIPAVTLVVVPLALAGIALPVDIVWTIAHALLATLMRILEFLATLPAAVWAQHAPAPWTVVVATGGVLLLLAPAGLPGRAWGLAWLLPLFMVLPARPAEGGFRLIALDVGQGLAVVVETAHHALLYDTGPRFSDVADAGGRVVAPYLRAAGIRALDALVVSHQDLDHAGGALTLMQTVPVAALWSSLPAASPIVARAGAARAAWRCAAGQTWTWDGVRFTILHPPLAHYAATTVRTNDLSCVVRVESPHGSALITGDIEAPSESALVRERPGELRTDVLVVPHHGSRTSSTLPFVAAAAPRVAIFTPGYRNRFGHPRPEVVARYARAGARLLRTDLHGGVTVDFAAAGPSPPLAARDARRRYWYDVPRDGAAPER